jgi:hypothetical protein
MGVFHLWRGLYPPLVRRHGPLLPLSVLDRLRHPCDSCDSGDMSAKLMFATYREA